MPRNVRPFWYELDVEGRASRVQTGPRSGRGSVRGSIQQRHRGTVGDAYLDLESNGSGPILRTFVTVRGPVADDHLAWSDDPTREPRAYILRADGTRVPLRSGDAIVLESHRD